MGDNEFDFSDFYLNDPKVGVDREERKSIEAERTNLANLSKDDDIEGKPAAVRIPKMGGQPVAGTGTGNVAGSASDDAERKDLDNASAYASGSKLASKTGMNTDGKVDYVELMKGGWDEAYNESAGSDVTSTWDNKRRAVESDVVSGAKFRYKDGLGFDGSDVYNNAEVGELSPDGRAKLTYTDERGNFLGSSWRPVGDVVKMMNGEDITWQADQNTENETGSGSGSVGGEGSGAGGEAGGGSNNDSTDAGSFTKEQILEAGQGAEGGNDDFSFGGGDGGNGSGGGANGSGGNGDGGDDDEGQTALSRAQQVAQYWEQAENQTYDDLRQYLEELDRQDEKRRRRSNWWELMVRGLTGGLNVAGAAAGAPSMDFTGSKEAFSKPDTDAYARLKDRKTQAIQLAQKRMEQMERQRESARKAYTDERNYEMKMDKLSMEKKRLESVISGNATEEEKVRAEKELIDVNKQIRQAELDHLPVKQSLEDSVKRSQINRNNRSGSGGSGGRSGGTSAKDKKEQKRKDNEYIATIASLASRSDADKINSVKDADKWVYRHKDNAQAKAAHDKYYK